MSKGLKWALATGILLSTTALSAQAEEYKIAAGKTLTGAYAFIGVNEANAISLAVDTLNSQNFLGEGNTLSVTIEDDANDYGQTETLLRRAAADEDVLVFLGTLWGPHAVALAPVLDEVKVPYLGTASTSEPVHLSPWYFKTTGTEAAAYGTLADFAVGKGMKRMVIVELRDAESSQLGARTFRDNLAAKGVEIAAEENFLSSETDFSAVATKIAEIKPDSVYIGNYGAQAGNLAVQLRRAGLGMDVAFYGNQGLGADFVAAAGGAGVGTYIWGNFDPNSSNPDIAAFVKAYTERYGKEPDGWAAVGYSQLLIAAEAIKRALPDATRASVAEQITQMENVPVVLGEGLWSLDAERIPYYTQSVLMATETGFVTAK